MDLDKKEEKMTSIYNTAIIAAEIILKNIGDAPWNSRMLLKTDDFLEDSKYQKVLLDKMEFFTPKEELMDTIAKLETMFQASGESEESINLEESEELRIIFCRKGRKGNPTKLFLEIYKAPYRIPFELHLIPFPDHEIFSQEKSGIVMQTQENFTYRTFPPEEYLTLAFYEIIKELELIKDMSWYHGVYDVLCKEPVNGRKFWESLNHLIRDYPIPSLEKRMETLNSYRNYPYMQKRWKSHCKRKKETYPQWEEVIGLSVAFLEPVFEGVLKDEVFLGDWMPQLGRYLD